MPATLIDTDVRHAWRLQLQRLELLSKHDPAIHYEIIVSRDQFNPKEVVKQAKLRFTAEWWENYLIKDISYMGKVVMIDNIPLYEEE